MPQLSKSQFLAGRQCTKRLWLEEHAPPDTPAAPSMPLEFGRQIDEIARALYPGVVVARAPDGGSAVAKTRDLLSQNGPLLLHQAAFETESLICVTDVLRRNEQNFDLIEVKATSTLKSEHVLDAAFQSMVLDRAGIRVSRVTVAHVDSGFILRRPGDYQGLLVEEDVSDAIPALLAGVERDAMTFLDVLQGVRPPTITTGAHCSTPFDCPFQARCHTEEGGLTQFPLSALPRGGKTAATLAAEGFRDLRDVPAERLTRTVHQIVHRASVTGEPHFDPSATVALRTLAAPWTYLDFETIAYAVPELIGTRPYEQLPFQWSIHVEQTDGAVTHREYLAVEDFANFAKLASALVEAVPITGPVFAYNASFEKGVLVGLGRRVPKLARILQDIADRLFDLLPVTQAAYYHPQMKGSWSIKAVLPTIDPELGYQTLGGVQHGEDAQLAFLKLRSREGSGNARERLRHSLLEYCNRDTYGLMLLARFLRT